MKIGVFGGTFDPIHTGHLIIAQQAVAQCRLDKLLIIPANRSPYKRDVRTSSAKERLAMVRRAVKDIPKIEASDLEIRRGGVSYTIDTLRELHRLFPRAQIVLIVGADSFAEIGSWHESCELMSHPIIVAPRRKSPKKRGGNMDATYFLEIPFIEISSSDIRRRIRSGLPVISLVPAPVESYIIRKGLYRNGRIPKQHDR